MARNPTPKKMDANQMRQFAHTVKQYIDERLEDNKCPPGEQPQVAQECKEPAKPELQLLKRCFPEGPHNYGDRIKYVFTVFNCGNVPLTNVCIGDDMIDMQSMKINLDPGEHAMIEEDYTVTAEDAKRGKLENIAKAEAYYEGICFSSTASHSCSVVEPPAPALQLTIKKPELQDRPYCAGEVVNVQYCVRNTGGISLQDIYLKDADGNVMGPQRVSLGVGMEDTTTFVATYEITDADVAAGCIVCMATACADVEGCGQISASANNQFKMLTKEAALQLVKSCEITVGDGKSVGDIVTYTLCIRNVGATVVDDLLLTDAMLGLNDKPVMPSSLQPATQNCIECDYALTQADIDRGEIVNTAEVKGMANGAVVSAESNAHTLALPELVTAWEFEKSCDPGIGKAGDTITYSFIVRNTGDVDISGITIDDSRIGVSGLSVPDIAAGGEETVTATYVLTDADEDAGEVMNIATVNGMAAGQAVTLDSNSHRVIVDPRVVSWTFEKSCDPGQAAEGDDITYSFVVTNTGETPLTGITIDDARIGVSGLAVSDLAPGASETVTATYTVTADDVAAGTIENVATVMADAAGAMVSLDSNQHVVTVDQPMPAMTLEKTGNVSMANPGDEVVYSFTVTNTGDVDLTSVTIDDARIGVSGLTVPDIAVGASETVTATYTVTDADLAAGEIVNTATANADANGTALDATSDFTVTVTADPVPAIEIVKNCDPGVGVSGDVIEYSFVVTNTGQVDLTGITIDDPRIAVSGLAVPDLAVGESQTVIASYTLTDDDATAGEVVNTATVNADANGEAINADSNEHTVTVNTVDENPAATVTKSGASLDDPIVVGSTVTYSITIENTGDTTLINGLVNDATIGAADKSVVDLDPGQTETVECDYVITQDDFDAGELLNTATYSASTPGGQDLNVDSNEHTLMFDPTCDDTPVKTTCTNTGGAFEATADDVPTGLTPTALTSGVFGTGEFGGSGFGSLVDIFDNGGVANIPIPAHTAGCALFLNIVSGQVENQGIPVLNGLTGSGMTPAIVSQEAAPSTPADRDSDIAHTVIAMNGDGNGGGSVDIFLPEIPNRGRAGASDLLQYQWIEVCSSNGVDVDYNACFDVAAKQSSGSPSPAGPDDRQVSWPADSVTFDQPSLLFSSGRHVKHAVPGQPGVTDVDADWTAADNGAQYLWEKVSVGDQFNCQAGLATAWLQPGTTNFEGSNNVATGTAARQDWDNHVLNTAIPLAPKDANVTPVDEIVGDCEVNVAPEFCTYPADAVCSFSVDVDYDLSDGAELVLTPIANGTELTAQAVTVNTAGADTVTVTGSSTEVLNALGDDSTCTMQLRVQITGAAGTAVIPDFEVCLEAQP